ncbi:MAG: anti-sigma factor [Sphingorhabdus sp.]
MTFDRATIAAFVDGELDLLTAKRLEKALEIDAALAKAVEDERALRSKLASHFAPVIDEALPDRLTALLTASIAENVDDSLGRRRMERKAAMRRPALVQWGAMAASLALGLMIGGYALNRDGGYVSDNKGQMVASGALSDALDTQLAATQSGDSKIRIGTSFASISGDYCRTFESATLDGIACNADGAWQLRQTVSGEKAAQYRQASAGALAEAAAAMMAGDPLDAAQEKAVQDRGWKR